jgi:MarC family membrane protein
MKKALRILCLLVPALLPAPTTAQSPTDIYLLELDRADGVLVVRSAPVAVTDRPGYDNQPYFTPDGRILYTSLRDGQTDTWRYDPAARTAERVTRTPESEYSPTPMPGSDRFSAVRVEADSTQRLWSFASDGSDARVVLENIRPVGYHQWLNGTWVALFVLGEPPTLRVADTSTGAARVVAERIGRSIQRVPEGEAVTFTQEVDDGWWIREYSLALDTVRTVARMLGPDEYHAWLPDRTLLTAHGTEVLRFDPDARDWVPIVDLADAGLGTVTRLATSGEGDRLAVVVDRPDTASADPIEETTEDEGPLLSFASLVIGSLLAMVNPLGALTIFVGLTATYTTRQRRLTAFWGSVAAAAILLVFALFGTSILRFFGITTHAFRIAGGIIFFGIGWDMLQAKRSRSKTTPEEEVESAERQDVAVVPLGIPTLAGPGAITTVIALTGQTDTAAEASVVYMGVVVVSLITLIVLWAGPSILRFVGQTGINVFTRLMGLLVMVIGVQFVIDGLTPVIREWFA